MSSPRGTSLSSLRESLDPENFLSTCGLATDNAYGVERAGGGAIDAAGPLDEARRSLAETLGDTHVVEAQVARA